jgi:hypothetical protein
MSAPRDGLWFEDWEAAALGRGFRLQRYLLFGAGLFIVGWHG